MPQTPEAFRNVLVSAIINPLIALAFAAALLVFVWGIVEFLLELSQGGDTAAGKQHMLWGIIGLFIMTAAFGILSIVTNTFGISVPR